MKVILLFCIVGFVSCLNPSKEQHNALIGAWSFLDDKQYYVEMYVDNESVSFFHEIEGNFQGNMKYEIRNDSLFFSSMSYSIEVMDDNVVNLENYEYRLRLSRIFPLMISDRTNQINPFYLRRCNFLVNTGIISMKEAIDYLNRHVPNTDEWQPEEESILR